jgi:hypothetical protein
LTYEALGALDPRLLHIITFGPGFGESVLVRVPPGGWLVVDSLRRRSVGDEENPAAKLLDALNARASCVVLTHPHLDHADGLPAILDRRLPGTPVGCLPGFLEPQERWRASHDTAEELRHAATEAALQRIFDTWERDPSSRWDLFTGSRRPIGSGVIHVVHPPRSRAAALVRARDVNRASSPLLVTWKRANILLGADLPAREWRRVPSHFRRAAALAITTAIKASHHGSGEAQHPVAIGTPPRRARPCLITPWTKGAHPKRLPRFDDNEGIHTLLECVAEVHLTSPPMPVSGSQRFARADAQRARVRQRIGAELIFEVDPAPVDVSDAWLHVAIDPRGTVAEDRLGPAAVAILP